MEALLKHRSKGNTWQYFIRWLGYSPEHDKLVYEVELDDRAGARLKQFKDSHGLH